MLGHNKRPKFNWGNFFPALNKTLTLVSRLIAVVAVVIIGIMIVKTVIRWNNLDWSFQDNTVDVTVKEPEYEVAMDLWACMDYTNAEIQFLDALTSSDSKNGAGSLESAAISQKLGALYLDMGRYTDAYDYLNSAYVTFQKELGAKDGNTIIAQGQIALYDIKLGDIEKGFATLNDLYDEATYFGHKIQIAQMLAQCETGLGNYERAIEWYNVLGELYSGFGINNVMTVNLLNDYGVLMISVGNYQEAIKSLTSAVSTWEQLELQEDETIANVYANLALAYASVDQNHQATEAFEKAFIIRKNVYGSSNFHMAMSYEALSYTYEIMGNYEKQKEYLDIALDLAIASVGENHMCTASIYQSLGEYYKSQNDLENAVRLHTKSLEIRKNILGTNSVDTVFVYEALAEDYRELAEYDIGIENADYAIEISERLYGRENLYTAHSYITASWLYSDNGNHNEAIRLASMALGICDRQKDNAGITRPYAYQTMGYAYMNAENTTDATKYLSKAITLYQDIGGRDEATNVTNTLILLSDAYLLSGDYDASFLPLHEALQILDSSADKCELSEAVENRIYDLYKAENDGSTFESWLETKKELITVGQ